MRRKQIWKTLVSTLMIGAMLCTEVPVMASDFADGTDVSVTQEVAENVGQEETDGEASDVAVEDGALTDPEDAEVDFSDEEESDAAESDAADVEVEQEDAGVSEEVEAEDFADSEGSSAVELGQAEDEDNLLGGGIVVEASTADWKYIYNKLGAALTEYCGNDTSVTIPKTVGGNNVIACKKDLLKEKRDAITSVTIEAELTSLPDGFFKNFEQLEEVSLLDTIKDLGKETFYWCRNLKTVKLPASLEKLGESAFYYCESLEKLEIPDRVEKLEYGAVSSCRSLKDLKLPAKLKIIGGSAFYGCSSLKAVAIPEGVESIEYSAFSSCTALESIELPDSIKTTYDKYGNVESYGVYDRIFYGCSSLKSVKLPKDLEVIKDSMFEGCTSLKTIELPAGITKIEEEAFKDCSSLSKIKLSGKVTEIGNNAFKDCTQLVSAYIPGSVQKIGENAFTGCSLLTIYGTENSYAQIYATENGIPFSTGEMPDSEFTEEAAGEWTILTDGNNAIITSYIGTETVLTIPKMLNGRKVIACKKNLLKDKADVITSVTIEAELTSLPDGFFKNFDQLEVVSLPDTIKNLGKETFYWCRNLKTVKLPASLEKLGESAFYYCESLEKLEIPDRVEKLEYGAVSSCRSLKDLKLPAKLKIIGGSAFYGCSSLKAVAIPEGVESIEYSAFSSCTALESIELPDSIKTTYDKYGNVESYGVYDRIFHGCSSLKNVKLPKDLEVIKESMFEGCTSLKSIELPAGITKIEEEAFKDCSSLSKIKLSDKITEIGTNAFKDCLVLTNLSVYSALKTIGDNAFIGDPFLVLSCINNPDAANYAKNNKILYTTVEIESSGKNYSTKIPKDTFSQIQEGQKLTIDAGDVNMEFDAAAVSAIKNASANSDVTLALKDVDKGNTGNKAQDTVIDQFVGNAGKVLDLSLKDSANKDVKFSNNNAGMFTITLPYTAPAGNNPAVYCIEEDGNMEEMQSSYNTSAHMITFETPHFSVFAIGDVTKQNHVHCGTEISKKATCTSAGQKAYYSCSCGKIFWDKECTREITNKNDLKNLTIPALGHNMVLAAAKVKATNTANGSEEKYRCSRCGMTQGGQNIARIARVTLYKGVNKTYNLTPGKWKLTKTKAATLKKNRLTVKKTGTVKVKDQITKQTVTIRIVNPTMSVNKKKITIKAKKKYQLKVKTVPVQKVKYSTSNKKIATVSSKGVIQAKKKGTVTITIKCGSLKKTCKVTVK